MAGKITPPDSPERVYQQGTAAAPSPTAALLAPDDDVSGFESIGADATVETDYQDYDVETALKVLERIRKTEADATALVSGIVVMLKIYICADIWRTKKPFVRPGQ